MLHLNFRLLIFLTALACTIAQEENAGNSDGTSENTPEAILYESEDKSENSTSIHYSEWFTGFHDVPTLLRSVDMRAAAFLCARGVFLLYNDDQMAEVSVNDMMIYAGKDLSTCVNPGAIKSMLQVQNNIAINEDTLTVFRDELFPGVPSENHHITDRQNEFENWKLARLGKVGSFIMMGPVGWMVKVATLTGDIMENIVYCLKSNSQSQYPICPVPYASKYIRDGTWIDATRGCKDPKAKHIDLEYCFDYDGQLHPVTDEPPPPTSGPGGDPSSPDTETPPPGPGPEVNETLGGSGELLELDPNGNCDDDLPEFAKLLRVRLTHDFMSTYQVQFPLNKAHSWRTEILDNTIEIVKDNVFNGVPDIKLLYFIRELYIYFAEKHVWSQGKGWPTKPKQRVMLVAHETQRCLMQIRARQWSGLTKSIMEVMAKAFEGHEIPDSSIDKEFASSSNLDVVMEFIWLSINFVGASCHAALQFQTDFWMDYMNVAYDMYLEPMAEFWSDPKKLVEIYEIIFGGLDLEFQHRSLCAITSALYKTIRLDKLPRPMSVEDVASQNNSTR